MSAVATRARMPARHLMLAALAALLYAGCYAGIKAGLAYAPPTRFAAWRAAIASALLFALLFARREPVLPERRLWLPTVALALVGPLAGFGAMFTSPGHTGVGLASVLGNAGPLFIILAAAMLLGEPLTRGKLVALACGLAGVALLALPSASPTVRRVHAASVLLPLLAAASGAAESLIVKWARLGSHVVRVAAWQYLLGAPVLFMAAAWREPETPVAWTWSFLVLLLLLGGGTTAAGTALWYWLMQREEVSRLSVVLFFVPVAGLALGLVFFGERISPVQWLGVLVILGGVGGATMLGARARRHPIARAAAP